MNTWKYDRGINNTKPPSFSTAPAATPVTRSPDVAPVLPQLPVASPVLEVGTPPESTRPGESRKWSSAGSRVFFAGFGVSLLLLMIEYLTAGGFPGWFLLVPSNPTTLLGALVGHQMEAIVGARWSDEAFFVTLAVESALWWYAVGVLVAVVRRRRAHRS